MADVSARREAASPYGEWDASVDALITYRYLSSRPRWIDRTHADNRIRLRRDLRTSAGMVLAAPLAIAMLDTAGINVDRFWILALTQIDMEILDPAVDVGEVSVLGQVIKEARSQIFTEAQIYSAADRDRMIGFGTANWSVICPTPEGHIYPVPGREAQGIAEVPLWQAYTGRRRHDGLLEIPGLRPEIGTERLHHGPMLVITETAALEAAAAALGTEALTVEHLALTIVAPGRSGPFVATPVVVAIRSQTAGCRVELRDQGRENRLVASAFARMRVAEERPC
jgi:acyl-coenzyme A thioesterase PaaI-like protein